MSTMGINVKIDVTKLDKSRFFVGKKGTYANLTLFIDTENPSEYGDHGTIRQQTSKEERQSGVKLPIIGNAKIFTRDDQSSSSPNRQQSAEPQSEPSFDKFDIESYGHISAVPDDDIPF